MSQDKFLIQYILDNDDINSLEKSSLRDNLAAYINKLIVNDFEQLIYLLYRVDVSEQKLKTLLKENTKDDAGNMIAALIINRQLEKIKSRREYRRDDNIIDEDESW